MAQAHSAVAAYLFWIYSASSCRAKQKVKNTSPQLHIVPVPVSDMSMLLIDLTSATYF